MIDLGDVVQVAANVQDANGVLVDPAGATLTITLPDGTTATPTVPLPSATPGQLRVDYPTVQAGRHAWRITTTAPVTAHTDVFNVAPADPGGILGLGDAKRQLNKTGTTDDEEIRSVIASATSVVEHHVGAVIRRTVVEVHHGGGCEIVLRKPPVISVTSIVVNGVTLDPSTYVVSDSGIIQRKSGSFPAGLGNVVVTYVAGRTVIPANFIEAAEIIIAHLWETQYNLSGGRPQLGEFEPATTFDPRFGFAIPRRATELLQDDMIPGV